MPKKQKGNLITFHTFLQLNLISFCLFQMLVIWSTTIPVYATTNIVAHIVLTNDVPHRTWSLFILLCRPQLVSTDLPLFLTRVPKIKQFRQLHRKKPMESNRVILEATRLDHLGVSIFDVSEHQVKRDSRRAENTCIDGLSMAQFPTTRPILVRRSSTRGPLAWVEECTRQNTWPFWNGCSTETTFPFRTSATQSPVGL